MRSIKSYMVLIILKVVCYSNFNLITIYGLPFWGTPRAV